MDERIGIVGGTGLYSLDGVEIEDSLQVETPFGRHSGPVVLASLSGARLAFLSRHGAGHVLSPSEVPYAANIYALKSLGVRRLVSVSAVGSMKEKIAPRDFVVPDQLLDRTKGIRRSTFFGEGVVGHISFGEPFCPVMRGILSKAAADAGARVHDGGTYICMEGPAFSTKAESKIYRSMGMDIIGMTAIPEAKLAREAGICYATLALVTDYDVWREATEEVTLEMVISNMNHNTALARETLTHAVAAVASASFDCGCRAASANAVITAPESRNPGKMKDLEVVLR
ncbi:S-methyl-5'-thioadenosine phosphorylase [Candidatus Fermentibacteria bacterium]|nr:S-methyl-5'-thioadenosine phosphorylase [Candidatus Fermentibacteria bacterium]